MLKGKRTRSQTFGNKGKFEELATIKLFFIYFIV